MKHGCVLLLLVTAATAGAACGGGAAAEETPGGSATAAIDGTTFAVSDVKLTFQAGEDGYFRIEGRDAKHPDDDCVTGLGGGLALYGELPSSVSTLADLSGRELPFEFTGDGDDFNLCFVGSNGLLGVDSGTVKFTGVNGSSVTFTFAGNFDRFDGEGGETGNVRASGSGTANLD
ncbi:MAG TPA: hypothetical protein VFD69_20210 [Vicinamibacterales bacterium]|nr:hypothetical protein [Vicinamibacterales bacterium]